MYLDTSHLYSCGMCTTDTKARWIVDYNVEADWETLRLWNDSERFVFHYP